VLTRSSTCRIRLLLLNQFTVKLAFNLLMPYLAGHLTQGLGYAAWAVGLVLSVRNISQRGMCLTGGRLADRLGCKRAIVTGCALRTAGFALLGMADTLPALVTASALTGFAGALFDPGVRAYLALEAGDNRAETFGRFNMAGQFGLLLGPLAGLSLAHLNFQMVSAVAAALFAALTLIQATALPARQADDHEPAGALSQIVRHRRLWTFSAIMTTFYLLGFQVYLALPLLMRDVLGNEQDIGMGELFGTSALVVLAGQTRLTHWARHHWTHAQSLARGLILTATAFLPLALIGAPAIPSGWPEELAEHIAIIPILTTAILLAIGTMLICPFEMDMIVTLAGNRLVASHYGLYATVSGLGVTLGGLLIGWLWDFSTAHHMPRLPWLTLVLLGCLGAAGLAAFTSSRKGKHRDNPPLSGR
jgi:MFS family permease